MPVELLQKDDCHLCDLALDVLAAAGMADFESRWIDDQPDLLQCYGLRVPVLRDVDSGAELDWPFNPAQVKAWLSAQG